MKLFEKNRKLIAVILGILGTTLFVTGLAYNISHFDSYNDRSHTWLQDNQVTIGYLICIISPTIAKKYKIAIGLAAIAIAFETWVYLAP
jgi:uncharacterized phosphosugar-binding protein